MAAFIYYFPGAESFEKAVETHGLSRLFCEHTKPIDPKKIYKTPHPTKGPDGKTGILASMDSEANDNLALRSQIGYHAESQTWTQCEDFWIGYETAKKPRPTDLVRERTVNGHTYELEDGNTWLCPIIRRGNGSCNLPMSLGYRGAVVMKIKPQYSWAWELGMKAWDECLKQADMTYEEAYLMACDFLSINYRVGKWEIDILGILDTSNYIDVFQAAIDGPFLKEYFEGKKDLSESVSSVSGNEGSSIMNQA